MRGVIRVSCPVFPVALGGTGDVMSARGLVWGLRFDCGGGGGDQWDLVRVSGGLSVFVRLFSLLFCICSFPYLFAPFVV